MNCPCCGGSIAGAALRWLPDARILVGDDSAARLSKNETALFDILWRDRATGRIWSAEDLATLIWDDPEGGPLYAKMQISSMASHIRTKIRPCGLTVAAFVGPGGGFRLSNLVSRARKTEKAA
jgi:hypothetical protein